MKYAFIGTYPPRECGIGTFTHNLFDSVLHSKKAEKGNFEGFVVAMNDHNLTYDYPQEVKLTIRQEHQQDYLKAAKYINLSGADICILQHEFGIYGGQNGVYILPLLHRLEIPLVVTLHTILKTPSYNEKAVLQEIGKMAQKIIVMSLKAIEFLVDIYDVPREKIALIEHGVPDIKFSPENQRKNSNWQAKKYCSHLGLLAGIKELKQSLKPCPMWFKDTRMWYISYWGKPIQMY